MSTPRNRTSADRCDDCALSRKKEDRFNMSSIDDDIYLDFEEACRREIPFWCHGANEGQVCRGWLAIMERRWRKEEWSVENPRERRPE